MKFRTTEKAPTGFGEWTFFWTIPTIDPDAELEYIVLTPDGNEYATMSDFRRFIEENKDTEYPKVPGTILRSDYSNRWYSGGDHRVFYGQHVTIKFRVSKGNIQFHPPREFLDIKSNRWHKKDFDMHDVFFFRFYQDHDDTDMRVIMKDIEATLIEQ